MEELVIFWRENTEVRWMAQWQRRWGMLIPGHLPHVGPGIVMEEQYTLAINQC